LLADIQTYIEHRGEIRGRTVAWIGDGNNMCNSFMEAAKLLDFRLNIACPKGYEPPAELVTAYGPNIDITREPEAAAKDADLVVTDVWSSMGKEQEQKARLKAFAGYEVNSKIMAAAEKDALFMHCLPAHRGEEVSADVIDGPQSVVWDEAENRLHSQKALLEYLLTGHQ
jgi:ornithine carbamoyltransferase